MFSSADEPYETMVRIEGPLTELHIGLDPKQLIDLIINGPAPATRKAMRAEPRADSRLTPFADAIRNATYAHEDLQNFACLIGDQVVCGQFGGAEKLQTGSLIRAVVSRRDMVWIAHALLCKQDAMIWTTHTTGSLAQRIDNYKFYLRWTTIAIACLAAFAHLTGPIVGSDGVLLGACIAVAYSVLYGAWDDYTTRQAAKPSTTLFHLLGFAEPERIRLQPYRYLHVHIHEVLRRQETTSRHGDIYCFQNGLDKNAIRYEPDFCVA